MTYVKSIDNGVTHRKIFTIIKVLAIFIFFIYILYNEQVTDLCYKVYNVRFTLYLTFPYKMFLSSLQ